MKDMIVCVLLKFEIIIIGLYVVTEGGHMLCYDVSGNAVEKKIETSSDSQSSDTVAVVPETELKTTDDCSWVLFFYIFYISIREFFWFV